MDTYRTGPQETPAKVLPRGLGLWVAFERALSAGDKRADLAVSIDRLDRAGATWVAPRAGAGGANDAAFDESSAAAYLESGRVLLPWIFPYRHTDRGVVAGFRRYFDAGAHGCILNAEFEYQLATAGEARALVALIRSAWAESQGERIRRGLLPVADEPFIAHAPPDYLGAGVGWTLSDEFVALDEVCDAIMPQVYAYEHDDRGHVHHLENVAEGYRRRGVDLARVWWVGCTYRPARRGGKETGPYDPQRVADDVIAFLSHELVRACPAPSLYSSDAITWINGDRDRVMAALEAFALAELGALGEAEEPDTEPGTPPAKRRSSQRLAAVNAPILEPGTGPDDWRPTTDARPFLESLADDEDTPKP